jgi:hypothetical protein
MKKRWLRGVLLGVSVALLLGGGVALAQNISIRTEPALCLECYSMGEPLNCLQVWSSGWLGDEYITYERWLEGGHYAPCPQCGHAADGEHYDECFDWHSCEGDLTPGSGFDVIAQPNGFSRLGKWKYKLTGDTSGYSGEFYIVVAEDCAGFGFVPEPGSIVLLGSGLMGLAGYATIRWRSRR